MFKSTSGELDIWLAIGFLRSDQLWTGWFQVEGDEIYMERLVLGIWCRNSWESEFEQAHFPSFSRRKDATCHLHFLQWSVLDLAAFLESEREQDTVQPCSASPKWEFPEHSSNSNQFLFAMFWVLNHLWPKSNQVLNMFHITGKGLVLRVLFWSPEVWHWHHTSEGPR